MPTAAKLVAAIIFAGVAWLAADQYVPLMPDGRPAGVLREVSAIIGVMCGWVILGGFLMKPRGRIEAMGTGVRTSLTIAFFVLLIFSVWDMLARSVQGRYAGPMEAVLDIFGRALVLGRPLFSPEVVSVLLLGGLIGGAVAQFARTRWK